MAQVIDAHLLLASPDRAAYPPIAGVTETELAATDPELLSRALGPELAGAVLVQRGRTYGHDNRLICDLAAAEPRLRAICSLDTMSDDAGAQAARLLALPGVAGLRLMEPVKGARLDWLGGPGARAAWRAVAEAGGVMNVHVFGWNREAALPLVAELLEAFPAVPLVIDNLGNPPLEQGPPRFGIDPPLLRLFEREQVACKISAMNLTRAKNAGHDPALVLTTAVALIGPERLCWGSDVLGPGETLAGAIEQAREATTLISADDAAMVLAGNVRRIFGLP